MIHEFVCYYSKVMFAAITKYFQWLGSMGPGMKIRFFWISKCSLKIVVIFEILQDVNWEAISKLVEMWCSFQIGVATVKSGGIAKLWIRYYGELCIRRQYSQCYRITQYTYMYINDIIRMHNPAAFSNSKALVFYIWFSAYRKAFNILIIINAQYQEFSMLWKFHNI